MSTPAPMPRHLPHEAAATPGGLFGGRQAARIRAIVNADLLPEERASADALVLTAWLTPAQRAQYASTLRAGPDTEEFAQRLADERRVVLEEGADPVADELESAAEAERQARQLPLRILEGALLAVAVGSFAVFALADVVGDDEDTGALAEAAAPYGAVMVLALVLAAIVGRVATRRRDRALLGWAVSRPGQLGRGLPLRRALQGESAGPAIGRTIGPAALVALGVLGIVAGAAVLLITLMLGDEQGWASAAPWLLGGGAVSLLGGVVAGYLRNRRLQRIARRHRATEWFGPVAS